MCTQCRSQYWDAVSGDEPRQESEYWEVHKFAVYADEAVQRAYELRYERARGLLRARGLEPRRLLDVGGGIGNFAAWAQRSGFSVVTTDVDEDAVRAARNRGLRAYTPGDAREQLVAGETDLVTLWDVIEHTRRPLALLEQPAALLSAGGLLLLETPDGAFAPRRIVRALLRVSGGRVDVTHPFYYYEHKVYYTERGLRVLLEGLGFDVVFVARWTSPTAKMVSTFNRQSATTSGGSYLYSSLARLYPLAETVVRGLGLGNKLILLARKR